MPNWAKESPIIVLENAATWHSYTRSLSDLPRMAVKIGISAQISLLFRPLFTNKLLKIMKIFTRNPNFSLIHGKSDRLLGGTKLPGNSAPGLPAAAIDLWEGFDFSIE